MEPQAPAAASPLKTDLELADLAMASARLHRGEVEAEVLRDLAIDPAAWPAARDDWLARIAERAEAGNLALAQRYVALYAEATEHLAAGKSAKRNGKEPVTRRALASAASAAGNKGSGGERRVERSLLGDASPSLLPEVPLPPPPPAAKEPSLSLYEYAMLRAEIAHSAGNEARVWNKYALSSPEAQEEEIGSWERKMAKNADLSREYRKLYADADRHWSRLLRR
jgi:hypothetical protein